MKHPSDGHVSTLITNQPTQDSALSSTPYHSHLEQTEIAPITQSFFDLELALLSCNHLDQLLKHLLVDLKKALNLSECNLILFDPEHAARSLLEHSQWLKPRFSLKFVLNHSLLAHLYPTQKSTYASSDTLPPTYLNEQLFKSPSSLDSYALLPLVHDNFLIGGLHLGSDTHGFLDHPSRIAHLSHYVKLVSICIANCITQENLKRLSIIDVLTKVNNRRSFDQELSKEVARAHRGQYALSCIFMDIDYFKIVNDKYGHLIGDRVLRTVGQFLKQQVRKSDFVARYGGEEFAILLPDCNEEKLKMIAQQLRKRFNGVIFRDDNGKPFKLTASIGLSVYVAQANDVSRLAEVGEALICAADKATYESKNNGRDRISFVRMEQEPCPVQHRLQI